KPGSQGTDSLAAELSHRSGHEASAGTRLAQHVHADQEPGRVSDCEEREWVAGRRGASGHRRDFGRKALYRLERRDQHFSFALLPAGHEFPAVAFERAQTARHYSGLARLTGEEPEWGGPVSR